MAGAQLLGERELIAKLGRLAGQASNSALAAGLRGGLRIVAKEMRRQVNATSIDTPNATSLKRGMRQSIGSRFSRRKGKKPPSGLAGFAVGKKGSKRTARQSAGKTSGVGVSPTTAHWFVLGTKERTSAGRKVGSIGAMFKDVAQRAASASAGPALAKALEISKARILKAAKRGR